MADGNGLAAYLQEQAFGQLDLSELEGGHDFKQFIRRLPEKGEHIHLGAAMRANAFDVLRYGYPLAPRYTVSAFEMKSVTPDAKVGESLYAYVLWPPGQKVPTPEYVCLGGTYASQDGEYRKNFTWWKEFCAAYEHGVKEGATLPPAENLLARLEDRTHQMVSTGTLELEMTVFPRDSPEALKIAARCDDLRLLVKLFVAQMVTSSTQLRAPHIQPHYTEALRTPREEMSDVLDPPSAKAKKLQFRLEVAFSHGSFEIIQRVRCGQKLMPLMRGEATELNNVRFPTWREIWVSQKLSDFKLNGRSAAFPYFNQWTTAAGVDEHLFENESMVQHFRTSEAATAALRHLEQARRAALADADSGLKHRLESFDYEMFKGVLFAEEHLLLAKVALIATGEWVGPTLGTLPHILGKSSKVWDGAKGTRLETVVFDLVFGCLAMHEIGIHSDLHFHNVTVMYEWQRTARDPERTCALYVAGPDGAKDAYVLPVHGLTGHIIDFSRAIINPAQEQDLARLQGEDQTNTFFRDQADRMLMAIMRWEPAFAQKYQKLIKGAAYGSQQELYNALTAIDYFALGRNLAILFSENKDGELAIDESVVKICELLRDTAHAELLRALRAVTRRTEESKKDIPKTPADIGRRILRKVFGHFLFSRWDPADLAQFVPVDAFNVMTPLRYSGTAISQFPPWAQPDFLVKFSGGLSIEQILSRGDRPLRKILDLRADGLGDAELELVLEHERSLLNRRPPPDAGSSWLA